MSAMLKDIYSNDIFDQHTETNGWDIAQCTLALANIAIAFSHVYRIPRYTAETRENNAEHSFMLALVCIEIARSYFPDLNTGLVVQFAIVHDLVELITGDVATFDLTNEELAQKEHSEHMALHTLCSMLPQNIAKLVCQYEEQRLPEARFVRFMDKHLPLAVNIYGTGSQVMHQDYDTFTKDQLATAEDALKNRFSHMFPESAFADLHEARDFLAAMFADAFEPARSIQTTIW